MTLTVLRPVPRRARGARPLRPIASPKPPLDREAAMAAALARVDAVVREGISEPLRAMVQEHLAAGGKRVRVALALECAAAVGVPLRKAVPIAAASELLHNATLIHDDLQDGDLLRRGAPTLWARHGAAQAINAGDVLLMLPIVALAEAGVGATRATQMATLARRAAATASGQADELALLPDGRLGWADYQGAAIGKTGQILAIPFEAAASLAGLGASAARAVGDLAASLGLVYQVADDVLDLYGVRGRDRVGNDLREGKVSAVVACHLELRPADRPALLALLRTSRDATPDDAVGLWTARMAASGAHGLALGRARDATAHLATAPLPAEVAGLRSLWLGLRERFLAPAEAVLRAAPGGAQARPAPPSPLLAWPWRQSARPRPAPSPRPRRSPS